jgi:hypothetical protein
MGMPILSFRRRHAKQGAAPLTPLALTPRVVEQAPLPRTEAAPAVRRRPALSVLTLTSIELLVAPFPSFREVGRFHQTLAGLPSVRDVHLRRLQHGTLQMRVECSSSGALIDELEQSWAEPFRIVAHEPHRIELALDAGQDEFIVEGRWA